MAHLVGKVPEKMVRLLLDRGRFVSGVQTFTVRLYLTVPQCKKCLQYGHETCEARPSCFRCGSAEHQARDCKQKEPVCVPWKLEGLAHDHRVKRECGAYKKQLDATKNKNDQHQKPRRPLKERAQEATTPAIQSKKRQHVPTQRRCKTPRSVKTPSQECSYRTN